MLHTAVTTYVFLQLWPCDWRPTPQCQSLVAILLQFVAQLCCGLSLWLGSAHVAFPSPSTSFVLSFIACKGAVFSSRVGIAKGRLQGGQTDLSEKRSIIWDTIMPCVHLNRGLQWCDSHTND